MEEKEKTIRIQENSLELFAVQALEKLEVSTEVAKLAVRSLLDASLLGIDTHGIEALEMYLTHLKAGGLKTEPEPVIIGGEGALELWDAHQGFGLSSARKIMLHAIDRARKYGIYLATCRNINHIGACGVYGKIAADSGIIGIVSQQTCASFSPWGGTERRIGASPFAFVAPVHGSFPFYFDASMAVLTRGQIKAYKRTGKELPKELLWMLMATRQQIRKWPGMVRLCQLASIKASVWQWCSRYFKASFQETFFLFSYQAL